MGVQRFRGFRFRALVFVASWSSGSGFSEFRVTRV